MDNARVTRLIRHAWTIQREQLPDGDIALRIPELPHFVVAGSEAEVADQFWGALEGYLRVAVRHGHALPELPEATPSIVVAAEGQVRDEPVQVFVSGVTATPVQDWNMALAAG